MKKFLRKIKYKIPYLKKILKKRDKLIEENKIIKRQLDSLKSKYEIVDIKEEDFKIKFMQ